jgi:hypothetical protein
VATALVLIFVAGLVLAWAGLLVRYRWRAVAVSVPILLALFFSFFRRA